MVMDQSIAMLCLPCAGASAAMYLRWRRLLPAWLRVVPVELPGRGARLAEDFVKDFDALVLQLCAEQAPGMQGRYVIFGHSMGALLAYGLARQQMRSGDPLPQALLLSASAAPSMRDPGRFAGKDNDAALIADLREQGGTPEEVFESDELLRLTLDTLGADYKVCQSFLYAPEAPLPMPLHVFAGRQDRIGAQGMQAWAAASSATCTLDWFDGGHFFLRQQEALFLDALVRRLAQTIAGGSHVAAAIV
ncbi:Surfactin synthase thioesterase subunit [Paracidovorax valerianellae]|uniref:Surfactin synthase thioesterase subunit n=2 Tax=Paracidovorax valerianellae TaxID=187868 RepID=A0A1G6NPB3_9BURK|nr:Surfactin synthase thioesterase subunit [Paracidovorax valerianellae]